MKIGAPRPIFERSPDEIAESDRLKRAYAAALAAAERRPPVAPVPPGPPVLARAPQTRLVKPPRPRWPEIGATRRRKGQKYRCIDVEPYVTRFGFEIGLLVIESDCPDCGRRFRCKCSKTNMRNGQVNRRCDRCKAPGKAVVMPRKRRAHRRRLQRKPVKAFLSLDAMLARLIRAPNAGPLDAKGRALPAVQCLAPKISTAKHLYPGISSAFLPFSPRPINRTLAAMTWGRLSGICELRTHSASQGKAVCALAGDRGRPA